jgi:eukaryotic-like serine/threonine-protein kinase
MITMKDKAASHDTAASPTWAASEPTRFEFSIGTDGTPPVPLTRPIAGSGRTATLVGPLSPAPSPPPESRATPYALAIGDVVAERYRIESVLGAGGMGIVFKAQHLGLGTHVAIKVIRPDIAQNSSLWRRFSREARALAALHNQHVVRVHDAGTLPSGLRYLVMELLVGTDLRRTLQEGGPLPVTRAVDYVLQVCSALGDAHRLNIIHRDIKPENIFIARFRAGEPAVKLLDFGVARFLDDRGQLTVPGRGVGSPRYLSPEQVQTPNAIDQRSDLWGVGLLLYELLTGLSPFAGMNTAQICIAICQGPIPPIEALRRDLPTGLVQVLRRCLEIDSRRRFGSADELSAALEPFSSRHVELGGGGGGGGGASGSGPRGDPQKPAGKRGAGQVCAPWRELVPRWLGGSALGAG